MTSRASLVVVIALGGTAAADPKPKPPAKPPVIDVAIQQAKAAHKALIAEFYTDWCKPCHVFEQTTLVDKRVQAAIGGILFVRYDAEAEPGLAAAGRYSVSSFPTFVAIDREGVARRTFSGIQTDEAGVQQFLAIVAESELATLDEGDVRARVKARPTDPVVRLAAGRWYSERGLTTDALVQLDAVASNPSAPAPARAEATATGDRLRRLALWKTQLVAEKLDHARRSPATIGASELAIATVDSGVTLADAREVFAKVFAAQTEPTVVNGLLYVAIAAGAKDEALAAARAALTTSKDPALLDTLAECFHVHGDRAEALRVEDQAMTLSREPASLAANRARFDQGTGDAPEVKALRAEAARLWKRLAHVEDERSTERQAEAPSAGQAAAMVAFMAANKLGQTVAKTCATEAGASTAAYARVTLDPAGKVTASVVYLDPDGTPALRACLMKNLAGAMLPVAGASTPEITIAFKSAH